MGTITRCKCSRESDMVTPCTMYVWKKNDKWVWQVEVPDLEILIEGQYTYYTYMEARAKASEIIAELELEELDSLIVG